MERPRFRRRLAAKVEELSGVRVRSYKIGGLVAENYQELLRLLSEGRLDAVGRLLADGVEEQDRSDANLRNVGEAVREIALSSWGSEVRSADQLRMLRERQEEISRRLDLVFGRRVWAGADEFASQLRVSGLFDRADDLDRLSSVMRDTVNSYGTYCVVSAPPWYGKTALMAELALDPPFGVDVVSFFVRATVGRNQLSNFLESVNRQMCVLLGEQGESGADDARRRALFERYWREASAKSAAEGRCLCLLIDGLDEQDPDERVPISALLPTKVPDDTLVLIAARPNPAQFPGCGFDHQLDLARRHPYKLTQSLHAGDVKRRADESIAHLRADPTSLASRCYGHLALTGIQLTDEDLADLLDEDPDQIQTAVKSFINLTTGDGTPIKPWELAHETLLGAVRAFRESWQAERIAELRAWPERWRTARWPVETPAALTDSYWKVLMRLDGTQGVKQLATDHGYVRRAASTPPGRAAMMAMTSQAFDDAVEQSDRPALLSVALARSEIMKHVSKLPHGAVAVLAAIGRWDLVHAHINASTSNKQLADQIGEAAPKATHDTLLYLDRLENDCVGGRVVVTLSGVGYVSWCLVGIGARLIR